MGRKFSDEDKQALVDLVVEEVELFRKGEITRLSKNADLAKVLGCSDTYIPEILRDNLDPDLRLERTKMIIRNALAHSSDPDTFIKNRQRAGKLAYAKTLAHMTTEQRVAHGKRVYKKGLAKIAPARRREIYESGLGSQTPEQMRTNWSKGYGSKDAEWRTQHAKRIGAMGGKIGGKIGGAITSKMLRKNAYNVEGRFCVASLQEGAVALMLEKYVPGYSVREGETFQVKDRGIDNGGIDFLVDGEFLEWHPIILYNGRRGDIPSREECEAYKKVKGSLAGEERADLEGEYKRILSTNYRNSRQASIDNSEYSGANVELVGKGRELYDFVTRHGADVPYSEFRKNFEDAKEIVREFKVKKDVA